MMPGHCTHKTKTNCLLVRVTVRDAEDGSRNLVDNNKEIVPLCQVITNSNYLMSAKGSTILADFNLSEPKFYLMNRSVCSLDPPVRKCH